jgi:hypothetical protein
MGIVEKENLSRIRMVEEEDEKRAAAAAVTTLAKSKEWYL